MEKMMKECMKPHPMLHSVSGVGLGMLVVGLWPSLLANATMWGIILIVLGVLGEFVMKK